MTAGAQSASAPEVLDRHFERSCLLKTTPEALFAHFDDQTRLAGHMTRPSAMMGGGRMTYDFDSRRGMAVGSRIRMGGSAFGITMSVEEEVTERDPPRRKAWQTIGTPRLLIVEGYAMGFRIEADGGASRLTVWIDYGLPQGWIGRLLGWLFAGFYARWCVGRMVSDAGNSFPSATSAAEPA
ncbi:hypothetical protein ACFQ1E_14065 [Sphingomonas canadensis]|uniref:Polyketide cyclase n=1 Tax=Sphingomonas canadensis TaxID=1219257 RepID=A0ABW3H8G8_9SPHN|nr:SRPBCC family protein [Sphingomonas canadensis]MCW3837290.1 SRPBCC family protein [Sphingomonas canadensis]